MHRRLTTRTVSVFIAATVAGFMYGPAAQAATPFARVSGRVVSLEELTGRSRASYETEYTAETRAWTVHEFQQLVRSPALAWMDPDGVRGGPPPHSLEEWRARCLALAEDGLFQWTARILVNSATVDRILTEHATSLPSFFDLDALRSAEGRQLACWAYIRRHPCPPADRTEVFGDLRRKWRYSLPRETFVALASTEPDHAFLNWTREALERVPAFAELDLKSHLLLPILDQAASSGCYARRQAGLELQHQTAFAQVVVSGYAGNRELVERYLRALVDAQGRFRFERLPQMSRWLRSSAPGVSLEVTQQAGFAMTEQDGPFELGRVNRSADGRYALLALAQDRLGPDERAVSPARSQHRRLAAARLAAREWAPHVEFLLRDWQPRGPLPAIADGGGTGGVVSDVEVDPFIKQPYPALFFDDFDAHRSRFQEFAAEGAVLSFEPEAAKLAALIARVEASAKEAKTDGVKRRYRELLAKLRAAPAPADQR